MLDDWNTPELVAAYSHFSRAAVYRAIRDGELEASKVRGRYRISRGAVERWLERFRVNGAPAKPRLGSVHEARGLRILLRSESSDEGGAE